MIPSYLLHLGIKTFFSPKIGKCERTVSYIIQIPWLLLYLVWCSNTQAMKKHRKINDRWQKKHIKEQPLKLHRNQYRLCILES